MQKSKLAKQKQHLIKKKTLALAFLLQPQTLNLLFVQGNIQNQSENKDPMPERFSQSNQRSVTRLQTAWMLGCPTARLLFQLPPGIVPSTLPIQCQILLPCPLLHGSKTLTLLTCPSPLSLSTLFISPTEADLRACQRLKSSIVSLMKQIVSLMGNKSTLL